MNPLDSPPAPLPPPESPRVRKTSRHPDALATATLSPALAGELSRVAPKIRQALSPSQFDLWVRLFLALTDIEELAETYLRASLVVVETLAPSYFLKWARLGVELRELSPSVSRAYFSASPDTLCFILPGEIAPWAALGRRLYRGTTDPESTACLFFELSPRLFRHLGLTEVEQSLVPLLDRLFRGPYDVVGNFLNLVSGTIAHVHKRERKQLLGLVAGIVERGREDSGTCLRAIPDTLSLVMRKERLKLLSLASEIAHLWPDHLIAFLGEAERALRVMDKELQGDILRLFERVMRFSLRAALAFLRNSPLLLHKLTLAELKQWCREGEKVLLEDEGAGVSYFGLGERVAFEPIILPTVELRDVREILRMYCKALMGRNVQVLSTEELAEKGIGWTSVEMPTTDGNAIFAPPRVQEFATEERNFEVFKVLVTHQAGHLEFGTFDFSYERPSNLFHDLRPILSQRLELKAVVITDFQRFFDLFNYRKLARDIFTLVEDNRIDSRLKAEYKGIRGPYQRSQGRAATQRAAIASLPLRELFVEALLQISLGVTSPITVPWCYHDQLRLAIALLKGVEASGATVEDSAEASIRIYSLLRSIPNIDPLAYSPEDWGTVDPTEEFALPREEDTEGQVTAFLEANLEGTDGTELGEKTYQGLRSVEFRGELKPELVQTVMRLRKQEVASGAPHSPISAEALRELIDRSAEVLMDWISGEDLAYLGNLFVSNLLKEQEALKETMAQVESPAAAPQAGGEAESFFYDEWDFREGCYRPKWCHLWQSSLREGSTDFFDNTLKDYPGLVAAVKKQFEMLRPESFKKMKKLEDGEEFDLDSVIEAIVEKKVGNPPSEKIYWKRNKLERDVAVVLLLDMSISTEEWIEEEYRLTLDPGTGKPTKGSNKRIIDLEKESLVLLIEALERIGDAYGIYGFSSAGKDNVQFFVIKDLGEDFSERVKRRIDSIAPVQGTRMGPAIRHAITKLEADDSKVKVLILLSDGRPQDRDYGADPLPAQRSLSLLSGPRAHFRVEAITDSKEKEYAVHDTKMALLEARERNIIPFCLSVDKAGHDYLRLMCGDIGYEVVGDIHSLPRRLPSLYRRLTT